MSKTAQEILREISELPPEVKRELSDNLQKQVIDQIGAPASVRIQGRADLIQKLDEGLESPASPLTDDDWKSLEESVTPSMASQA